MRFYLAPPPPQTVRQELMDAEEGEGPSELEVLMQGETKKHSLLPGSGDGEGGRVGRVGRGEWGR